MLSININCISLIFCEVLHHRMFKSIKREICAQKVLDLKKQARFKIHEKRYKCRSFVNAKDMH